MIVKLGTIIHQTDFTVNPEFQHHSLRTKRDMNYSFSKTSLYLCLGGAKSCGYLVSNQSSSLIQTLQCIVQTEKVGALLTISQIDDGWSEEKNKVVSCLYATVLRAHFDMRQREKSDFALQNSILLIYDLAPAL